MKKFLKETVLASGIFLLLWTFASGTVSAKTGDVAILSMNDREVTLEFTLPPFEMETVEGPDETYQRIQVDGLAKTAEAGYPELPVKAVTLQVPTEGKIAIQILDTVQEIRTDCLIYPAPALAVSDSGERVTVFTIDDDAYHSSVPYPEEIVQIDALQHFRGTPIIRVQIYPFQWNAATRELSCYKKIRMKVVFDLSSQPMSSTALNGSTVTIPDARQNRMGLGNGQQSEVSDAFEEIKKGAILNYKSQRDGNNLSFLQNERVSDESIPKSENNTSRTAPQAMIMDVKSEGIYKLTYEELSTAGLPSGINVQTIQLFNLGNEAALKITAGGEIFGPGDYLEFYADAFDNQFTGTNVYWLYWGQSSGKRMGEMNGAVTTEAAPLPAFSETIHFEENHTLWESMPGAPEEDYWFWEKMAAPKTSTFTLTIPSPDKTAEKATLQICFRGRTTASPHPNHHTVAYLNGTKIGDAHWDNTISYVQTMEFSPGLLVDGSNSLSIELPGDTGASVDTVFLNWLEIQYNRQFKASNDELKFTVTGEGKQKFEILDLSSQNIRVFDITNPLEVKEVKDISVKFESPTYNATFEDTLAGSKTYYLLTEESMGKPDKTALWQSPNLASTGNGADWIVITARDFLPSAEPLITFRKSQGLRVKAVAIEDLYNEFNFGLAEPEAIKEFLQYAYENWQLPAPTYIFLIGDASTDYRNYLGSAKKNVVPPHLCRTSLGVTPTDNWYVCMDGAEDLLPDMFIGRIPGNTEGMVSEEIAKITGFESSTWPVSRKALFVADNNEISFEDLNESLIPYLPSDYGLARVYLRTYSNVNDATEDIVKDLDAGAIITNYVGHGAVTNWAGEYLFDTDDVPTLTNADRLTFVMAMTCLNGYFSQPFYYSLAEAFASANGKGSIGSFAPSGLGYVWEHKILSQQVFSLLFEGGKNVLGALTTQAKIEAYALGVTDDMMKTFTFFGDPATRLKVAESDKVIVDVQANGVDGPLVVSPEKSVEISASLFPGSQSGSTCDWWVGAETPVGTSWLEPARGWVKSSLPISLGMFPFFQFTAIPIFKEKLSLGIYTFSFSLDNTPDGSYSKLTWYDYVNVICTNNASGGGGGVILNIKANGVDRSLSVKPDTPVNISVLLNPGELSAQSCDWWVGATTPFGTFWLAAAKGWILSDSPIPAATAGLVAIPETSILNIGLPTGIYTFYFLLDKQPNGVLDDISWYDYVNVVSSN